MNVLVKPTRLCGTIPALPSKSQAHRMLICAALAQGTTRILSRRAGQDMDATVRCLQALGAQITHDGEAYTVLPIGAAFEDAILDVGESGSTLRFLLPIVCALGVTATFRLHGRLAERPLEPLWSELQRHGAQLTRTDSTIHTAGQLIGRSFTLAANVSSQFLSGILMALPLLGGGALTLEGTLESAGYLNLTIDALRCFGAHITYSNDTYTLSGALQSPTTCRVEGDWSNAAFWLCANEIGENNLAVTGLDPASAQGDRAVTQAISAICAGNATIDCAQIPDLVPPLAALAATRSGTTRFVNAARLRLKESNRIASCAALVRALGASAEELPDGLYVTGQPLCGGTVDSFGDHRIAMAAAITAAACKGGLRIKGAQAVEKSYAAFWDDLRQLGGDIEWEDAI